MFTYYARGQIRHEASPEGSTLPGMATVDPAIFLIEKKKKARESIRIFHSYVE